MSTASTFIKLTAKETLQDEWQLLDDPGDPTLSDIAAVLVGLLFFIVPGLVALWDLLTRPKRVGHLCITNWRLLYYETGRGWIRSYHYLFAVDLADIVGVHSTFDESLLGNTTVTLVVHTRFEDRLPIVVGDLGGIMSKLPGIGRLFRRRTIGKDAFALLPVLFPRIKQRQSALASSSSSF